MSIDWFPGHMVAAQQAAAETLRRCDVVIELLDARAPGASCNPLIEALRRKGQRPALKVLNKADVADPERTRLWLQHYNAQPDTKAIAISSKLVRDAERVPKECLRLVPVHGTVQKPLRMMILGVPNVGKSTLMNALLKRHVAKVGDEPGITRTQVLHQIRPGLSLVDTAGMLWPRLGEHDALRLAATNCIGIAAYDDESVAVVLGEILLRDYRDRLEARFGELGATSDGHALLAHIAKRRSLVVKGGMPDIQKAALVLLTDFRKGALGAMTLEVPGEPGA